jgi:hypothetical protein
MMKKLIAPFSPQLLLVVAFLSLAPGAKAQKSYAVGFAGGAAIPTGQFSDGQSTGYGGTAFIALGVPDLPFGVRFDGIYSDFSGRTVTPAGGVSTTNPRVRVMGLLGNLIYSFPGTSAKPYLVTGGGIYNTKADVADARSENDFGYNAGFGATFGVGRLAAFVEVRYHGISREAAKGGNIQFVPITLGIMF